LIVPGLSSSSILICLGLFEPMTAGLGALDFSVILPMLIGIAATALLFARLVHILYKKHFAVTSRVILGFVIASALKILPTTLGNSLSLLVSLACFAIGFALASVMDNAKIS
jgi:putative membrane protein